MKKKHVILLSSAAVVTLPLITVSAYAGITNLIPRNQQLSEETKAMLKREIMSFKETGNFRVEFNPSSIEGESISTKGQISSNDERIKLTSFSLRNTLQAEDPSLEDFDFSLTSFEALGTNSIKVIFTILKIKDGYSVQFSELIHGFKLSDSDFLKDIEATKPLVGFNTKDNKAPKSIGVDRITLANLKAPVSQRGETYDLEIIKRDLEKRSIVLNIKVTLNGKSISYETKLDGLFSAREAKINEFFADHTNLSTPTFNNNNSDGLSQKDSLAASIFQIINSQTNKVNDYFTLTNSSGSIPFNDNENINYVLRIEGALSSSDEGTITLFANAYSDNKFRTKINSDIIALPEVSGFLSLNTFISTHLNNFSALIGLVDRLVVSTKNNSSDLQVKTIFDERTLAKLFNLRNSVSAQTFVDNALRFFDPNDFDLESLKSVVTERAKQILELADRANANINLNERDRTVLEYFKTAKNLDVISSYLFSLQNNSRISLDNNTVSIPLQLSSSLVDNTNSSNNVNFVIKVPDFITEAHEKFLKIRKEFNAATLESKFLNVNFQLNSFDNNTHIPSEFLNSFLKNNQNTTSLNDQLTKLKEAFNLAPVSANTNNFTFQIVPIKQNQDNKFLNIDATGAQTKSSAILYDDINGTITFWIQATYNNNSNSQTFNLPLVYHRKIFLSVIERNTDETRRIARERLVPQYTPVEESETNNGSSKLKEATRADEVSINNLTFKSEDLMRIGAPTNLDIRVISLEADSESEINGLVRGLVSVQLGSGKAISYEFELGGFASQRLDNSKELDADIQALQLAQVNTNANHLLPSNLLTTSFTIDTAADSRVRYQILKITNANDIQGTLNLSIQATIGNDQNEVQKVFEQSIVGLTTVEALLNDRIDSNKVRLDVLEKNQFLPSELRNFGLNLNSSSNSSQESAAGFRDRVKLQVFNGPTNYNLNYEFDGLFANIALANDDEGTFSIRMRLSAIVNNSKIRSKVFTLKISNQDGLISNGDLANKALSEKASRAAASFIKIKNPADPNNAEAALQAGEVVPEALKVSEDGSVNSFLAIGDAQISHNGKLIRVSFKITKVSNLNISQGSVVVTVRARVGTSDRTSDFPFDGLLTSSDAVQRAFETKKGPRFVASSSDSNQAKDQILVANVTKEMIQFSAENDSDISVTNNGSELRDKNYVQHTITDIRTGDEERRGGFVTAVIRLSKGTSSKQYTVKISGFKVANT